MFILRDKSSIGLSTNLMLMAAAYNAPGPVLYLSISLYLASVPPLPLLWDWNSTTRL